VPSDHRSLRLDVVLRERVQRRPYADRSPIHHVRVDHRVRTSRSPRITFPDARRAAECAARPRPHGGSDYRPSRSAGTTIEARYTACPLPHPEACTPDVDLRVWLESTGVGVRSGMSLALGAAYPDLLGSFERGDHHVGQDDAFVMRVGVPRGIAAVESMLRSFGVAGPAIDHFVPAVSSMRWRRS